jgi:hypothetical protein
MLQSFSDGATMGEYVSDFYAKSGICDNGHPAFAGEFTVVQSVSHPAAPLGIADGANSHLCAVKSFG